MSDAPKMIFVNLPVADLPAATAFYEAIGFVKNPAFSNERGAAMVWSDTIYVMLLDRAFYATFTPKPIADSRTYSAALYALSFGSREAVDAITEAAAAAGAHQPHPPEDLGFMYSRAFEDPDGHGWGPFWMNPAATPPAEDAA